MPRDVEKGKICSVTVMSYSLWPCGLQHARLPCPSLSLGICSDSYPLSLWYYLTISSSATLYFCLQSFPASGSLQMSVALCIRWPKYWNFSFSISSSSEYSWLISFRMDWLDFLAVQGTLKSLLLHHSSKASILWHSAFFMVQLSHPYMTTGKTIALNVQNFVGKVMPLLFNIVSRFVITLLPRSKCLYLFILAFSFMAAVTICSDFGAQENKVCHYFHFSPIYLPWSAGTGYHDPSSLNIDFRDAFSPSSRGIRELSSAYLRLLVFLSAIFKN